ncbi:hypothetical protein [Nocardia wallacei]|uniref:hypothetical protein n=1 Tax=Nocardia wallacei TaxID=480035 RepID=UPI002455EA63|nr:hypothetical protein [Nocardia wallacei]
MIGEVAGALGALGLGGAVVTGIFGRRKQQADARKAEADQEKARAEAVQVLTMAAAEMVQPLRTELALVRAELAEVRANSAERDAHRAAAAVRHMAWDNQVASTLRDLGCEDVLPPPPLE